MHRKIILGMPKGFIVVGVTQIKNQGGLYEIKTITIHSVLILY